MEMHRLKVQAWLRIWWLCRYASKSAVVYGLGSTCILVPCQKTVAVSTASMAGGKM